MEIVFVNDFAKGEGIITVKDYWDRINGGDCLSVIGSGKPEIRARMMHEIKPPFASIADPNAVIYGQIGHGCVIAPGAVIAPNTCIADHVLINYNATVGHDSVIGKLSVIGPNASIGGNCQLGEGVFIGAGARIRENVCIGNHAIVGMGAVVTRDVPDNITVFGVPAKPYRHT